MTKVLILTAAFGEGHNAAARGLKAAFEKENVQAEILDLFSKTGGSSYDRSRRAYVEMVNKTPWLWAGIYKALHLLPLERWLGFALRFFRAELYRALNQIRPSVVVSVYPLYGSLFEASFVRTALPGATKPQFFTVITDSITINAIWYRSGHYPLLLPNTESQTVLQSAGIPRNRIHVGGFPVSPSFAAPAASRPEPGVTQRPKVLFMVNGHPDRALALVNRLQAENRYDLTVTVGRDDALKSAILQSQGATGSPIEVLGWVEDVPSLLRSNHVLIGKAGGATVQETLAAATPMIMTQIFPGQEEGNARLLIESECGAFCDTPCAVAETLGRWFADGAIVWKRLHQNTLKHGRPNAALDTARWILSETGATPLKSE